MRAPFLLAALALAPAAHAASLETFLAAARESNPDIAAAEARYDVTRAGVDVARSSLLPSVTAGGSYTRNVPEVKTTLPFGEDPLELVIQPADQLSANARLTVPLIVPGAIAGTTAAAAQRDAGEAVYDRTAEATLLGVVQTYWTVVAADRIEVAARESLAAAESALEIAQGRYALDAASLIEVRRAEADVARAKQALVEVVADRRDAERNLVTLTGLADAPDAAAVPRTPPDGDLLERARAANPELRALRSSVEASKASLASISWTYAPTVSGFAIGTASNATGFSGETFAGSAGVQVGWTLLDGGLREGRAAQARASLRESEARLEMAERTVADDVAQAIDAIEAARLKVEAADAGVLAATEARRLAEEQFRLGLVDASTLALGRRDAFQAEVTAALAELELGVAVEQLRFLVGEAL